MKDPQEVQFMLGEVFRRIHQEHMQGIPILNTAIEVQALGFQYYEGRTLGVLITPWLMNVVMLPADGEDWSGMSLGQKQPHKFPSGTYKFMINEIDGIGTCQTHSLHSPMRAFANHDHALKVAENFLDKLMVEREPGEEDLVDEELLGKVMRGEVIPETSFEDFAALNEELAPSDEDETLDVAPDVPSVSRRDLLRGKVRGTA